VNLLENDPEIQENIRIILSYAQELNRDFRERDIQALWLATSAINVAAGDIVRRIVKAIP
jgi:hypothetical protein